jgi:FtsP/CotA-like multicopper oxidase with cupredoxin domain
LSRAAERATLESDRRLPEDPKSMRAHLRALGAIAAAAAAAIAVGWLALAWYESRLPDTYNVMDYGTPDYGGGRVPVNPVAHGAAGHNHAGQHLVPVPALRGPRGGIPDARFTLIARTARVKVARGHEIEALTFDGRVPGPELRVRQGDLVEVELRNADIGQGVSLHWHGVDVPNAEDGVAGVTQNAVPPGGRHVYRFRAEQLGTFWYHTHQSSSEDVKRGLYGAFVIEPRELAGPNVLDETVILHRFGSATTLSGRAGVWRKAVTPGTEVRLRLVNTDSSRQRVVVGPVPFRVLAIDGTDLNRPTPLVGRTLVLGGGGRYDVGFRMPPGTVNIGVARTDTRLVLSPGGDTLGSRPREGREFDPIAYGSPTETPFDASSEYDRSFRVEVGEKLGFFDGRPGRHWTLNGGIFPDVPTFVVEKGDLVRAAIVNETNAIHPMHLHGHHMLVLSRNGRPVSGSPWWSDTLDVGPHERYTVAFRADNPGLWMDHCHNLGHAAAGLTMHLAYAGVTTPFVAGDSSHNPPE